MITAAEYGAEYQRRGLRVLLYPSRRKFPAYEGWPERVFTPEEIAAADGQNVGIVTGAASGGYTDADLDCPEAVALAGAFLPGTDAVFGRQSKPRSHFEYVTDPVPAYTEFKDTDADGTVLLELRTDGHQTMVPPSVHPSGERVEWDRFGNPAHLAGDALMRACCELASAALLARHWPKAAGSRQDVALALAGRLLRAGWDEDRTGWLIGKVAAAGGDDEASKRATAAGYTAKRLAAGDNATGWRRLAELVGAEVVNRVREWLGATDTADTTAEVNDFEAAVSREAFTVRVRAEARRRIAAETAPPQPFDAGMLADIVVEPVRWRVEGFLPAQGRLLVAAQRKTGKTTLALNLVRDAAPRARLPRPLPRPTDHGRVGFMNFEVSRSQLCLWAREASVPGDRLLTVHLRGRRNPFADADDTARLAALCGSTPSRC